MGDSPTITIDKKMLEKIKAGALVHFLEKRVDPHSQGVFAAYCNVLSLLDYLENQGIVIEIDDTIKNIK